MPLDFRWELGLFRDANGNVILRRAYNPASFRIDYMPVRPGEAFNYVKSASANFVCGPILNVQAGEGAIATKGMSLGRVLLNPGL